MATTASLIRAEGRDALVVPGDLLDRASLGAAAATVLERWGRVDVLVNNARYIGPGHMDRFLDTPLDLLDKHLDANVMAPLVLARLLAPQMIDRGDGLDRERHVGRGVDGAEGAGRRGRVGTRLRDLEGRAAPRRRRAARRAAPARELRA